MAADALPAEDSSIFHSPASLAPTRRPQNIDPQPYIRSNAVFFCAPGCRARCLAIIPCL